MPECARRLSEPTVFSRRTKLKLPGIKWVFLDMGSTLVNEDDIVEDHLTRLQAELNRSGISVSLKEIRDILHEAVVEQKPSAIFRTIARLTDSEELKTQLRTRLAWRRDLEKPYPEAKQVLAALSGKYRIGIIANQHPGSEARLQKWGLLKFISLCLPSAETGLSKPDLAFFQLAMEKSGCLPEHAVMVGDRLDNDIAPAKSLGWKTIRVQQGYFRSQIPMGAEQEPDFEVGRLRDILDICREIAAG